MLHDLKVVAERCSELQRGSLNRLAEQLGVRRDEGSLEHTAGSDSKLTARCFFALKNRTEVMEECENIIYNLEVKWIKEFVPSVEKTKFSQPFYPS